jgi:hypothetical protein
VAIAASRFIRTSTTAIALAALLLPLQQANSASASSAITLPRSEVDRPDDTAGPQVHVIYALPSDGRDRTLDADGTLTNSVASFNAWLAGKTGGRPLRLDTYHGSLDVSFLRLNRTDSDLAATGHVVDTILPAVEAAGFDAPDKIYAVYYDGTSTEACGQAPSPGHIAAMYLHGLSDSPVPCDSASFAGAGGAPTYLEFTMLHEIMHALGVVPSCAPHQWRGAHVSDNPNDLMWAGDGNWAPDGWNSVILDANHDDYYKAGIAGCFDLDSSPYLTGSATSDRTAPKVSSRSPSPNARGVSRATNVRARFSEAVRGVSSRTAILRSATGAAVRAKVTYDARTHLAVLDPAKNLAPRTRYTVVLKGGRTAIRDRVGNALVTTSWSFTTRR